MIKFLVRDSAIYAVGVVASRMVGFIMIPVYTRVLTPVDYGILEVVNRSVDVLGLLLALGIAHAILRYYNEPSDGEQRRALVSTAALLGLSLTGVGLALLLPLAPVFSSLVFRSHEHVVIVRMAIGGMLVGNLITLPLTIMRARSQAWRFTLFSILQLFTTLSLNILLVVEMRLGVLGVILSTLVSNLLWGAILMSTLLSQVGVRFHRGFARQLLGYGLPLVPASLATFVLNFSDRFFLVRLATAEELGLYSLAYRFAMLVSVFFGLLANAWWPWAFRVHKLPERSRLLREGGAFVVVASAVVCTAIILFSKPVIRLMAAAEFLPAADYVPLLAVAYWFFSTAAPLSLGSRIAERTDLLAAANGIAAVICILLSMWLIPEYGVWGAVWVTVLSFAVRAFAIHGSSQLVMKIQHQWSAMGLCLVALAGATCYSTWTDFTTLVDLALRTTLALVLIGGLGIYYLRITGGHARLRGHFLGLTPGI